MALETKPTVTGWGTGATTYDRFLEREGIPTIRGLWVENVCNLPYELSQSGGAGDWTVLRDCCHIGGFHFYQ